MNSAVVKIFLLFEKVTTDTDWDSFPPYQQSDILVLC